MNVSQPKMEKILGDTLCRRLSLALLVFGLLSPALTVTAQEAKKDSTKGGQATATVKSIEAEAAAIERSAQEARRSGKQWLTKDARYWDLGGFVAGDGLRYVIVRFAQGRSVRDETYYYKGGSVILAKVRKSWDVDNPRNAPSAPVTQSFFLDGGEIISRRIVSASSRPKVAKVPPQAAAILTARAKAFAQVLTAPGLDRRQLSDLEVFPEELDPE
jgi:hypothetical protein